jgi:hypothetical protein
VAAPIAAIVPAAIAAAFGLVSTTSARINMRTLCFAQRGIAAMRNCRFTRCCERLCFCDADGRLIAEMRHLNRWMKVSSPLWKAA